MTSYFHGFDNLEWKSMDHQFPDNQNSFYTRVPGMIKMGMVKLEQDGHFQLHQGRTITEALSVSVYFFYFFGCVERYFGFFSKMLNFEQNPKNRLWSIK